MGLEFNEKNHRYSFDGVELISANQFISLFHEPFEEKKIAYMVAKKRGTTMRNVIAEWNQIKADGTSIHELCEELIINGEIKKYSPRFRKKLQSAILFLKDQFSQHEIGQLVTEKQLYDLDYNIAGTADIISINDKKKTISVFDWKTNNKIDLESYQNKTFDDPIQHLAYTKYNKYCLQLSIYGYMLQKMYPDYVVQELAFINIRDDGFVKYNTPYMYSDIQKMLDYHKKRQLTIHEV